MGGSLGSGGGPMADINVTPLIDVVLVLLVVFMVVTPMIEIGRAVDLPVATRSQPVTRVEDFVVMTVTADGQWWLGDDRLEADTLLPMLDEAQKRADSPPKGILVRADTSLRYEQVRALLDELARNGITAVTLGTADDKGP